jgi:hypothetical protein
MKTREWNWLQIVIMFWLGERKEKKLFFENEIKLKTKSSNDFYFYFIF